jgi:hypothetical protein
LVNYLLRRDELARRDATQRSFPMESERSRQVPPEFDSEAAVAEFIRIKGVTRCPTACVLPTRGSVAVADREALEEHAIRRAEHRRAKAEARAQQFWTIEMVRPLPR